MILNMATWEDIKKVGGLFRGSRYKPDDLVILKKTDKGGGFTVRYNIWERASVRKMHHDGYFEKQDGILQDFEDRIVEMFQSWLYIQEIDEFYHTHQYLLGAYEMSEFLDYEKWRDGLKTLIREKFSFYDLLHYNDSLLPGLDSIMMEKCPDSINFDEWLDIVNRQASIPLIIYLFERIEFQSMYDRSEWETLLSIYESNLYEDINKKILLSVAEHFDNTEDDLFSYAVTKLLSTVTGKELIDVNEILLLRLEDNERAKINNRKIIKSILNYVQTLPESDYKIGILEQMNMSQISTLVTIQVIEKNEKSEISYKLLLKHVKSLANKNINGVPSMFVAIMYHRELPLFSKLIKHIKDINIRDKHGNTILHVLASRDEHEFIKLLLTRRPDIDINAKNKFKERAIDIALENDHDETISILGNLQTIVGKA